MEGFGQTIQFHPNTTYESFVGGLAPLQESSSGNGALGFRFPAEPVFELRPMKTQILDGLDTHVT